MFQAFSRWQPWVVCLSAALFFFYSFIQLTMLNVIGTAVLDTFHLDATVLASISDKYFLGDMIFLFPAGMLLDRFSTRRLVLLAMIATVISTYFFAVATDLWALKTARFIIGVAASFCLLSCVRLASRWFSSDKMALVIGCIVTIAMLGGLVAQAPFSALVHYYGWRHSVLIDAVFGVCLTVLIFFGVKDHPAGMDDAKDHPPVEGVRALWQGVCATVSNRQNWWCGLYTSLMNLPVFLIGALWGGLYLQEMRHLSASDAAFVSSLFFIGIIVGSPLFGGISDRLQQRRQPMLWGALLSFVAVLLLIYVATLNLFELDSLFFLIGLFSSAQILSYPVIAESNPMHLTGTAEGLASVLIMAGGFSQLLFAYVMGRHWTHQYWHHLPQYAPADFKAAMMIMPLCFFMSFVLALLVRETHGLPYKGDCGDK